MYKRESVAVMGVCCSIEQLMRVLPFPQLVTVLTQCHRQHLVLVREKKKPVKKPCGQHLCMLIC